MRVSCFIAILLVSGSLSAVAENWPRFRGNNGDGKADCKIPTEWKNADYRWSINLAEEGTWFPFCLGNRVFLNAATDEGKTRKIMCVNAKYRRNSNGQVLPVQKSQNTSL